MSDIDSRATSALSGVYTDKIPSTLGALIGEIRGELERAWTLWFCK